jgi:hypothetical protein
MRVGAQVTVGVGQNIECLLADKASIVKAPAALEIEIDLSARHGNWREFLAGRASAAPHPRRRLIGFSVFPSSTTGVATNLTLPNQRKKLAKQMRIILLVCSEFVRSQSRGTIPKAVLKSPLCPTGQISRSTGVRDFTLMIPVRQAM